MTKEQLLGRLLMNGNINIDELNLLNNGDKTTTSTVNFLKEDKSLVDLTKILDKRNDVATKKEQESGNFDWLDKLKKRQDNPYNQTSGLSPLKIMYTFRD